MVLMNNRIHEMKQKFLNAPVSLCIERAKYYTEVYKDNENLHPSIRAAKALEKTLKNMSIFIEDDDQIVGYRTSKKLGIIIPIERGETNTIFRLALPNQGKNPFYHISKRDKKTLLKELIPYWDGKTVIDKKMKLFKENNLFYNGKLSIWKFLKAFGLSHLKHLVGIGGGVLNIRAILKGARYIRQALLANSPNGTSTVLDDQGHLIGGHNNLVKSGFGELKERALEILRLNKNIRMATNGGTMSISSIRKRNVEQKVDKDNRFSKNTGSEDNNAFLEAVIICCDAAAHFINRFAELAKNKAEKEKDNKRAKELRQISDICKNIAYGKPNNFREAVQLVWFNEIIGNISHGTGVILSLGRPDQYLYPFYKSDIESGLITDDEALEILEELLIKSGSNLLGLPSMGTGEAKDFGSDHIALAVGGVDKEGNDATNDLSYLFLKAYEDIKGTTVSFSVRLSPNKSSREWIERAIETYLKTSGVALYNDEIIIKALERNGVSLKDARDYSIVGCVEPAPQGNAFPITAGNAVGLCTLFEMLLNNGESILGGGLPDLKKFDSKSFNSFEELFEKFKQLIRLGISHAVKCSNLKDKIYAENFPNPFISMTLEGCLENALDMTQGGAKYNYNTLSSDGFATIANSLISLKKVVFEEREISLPKMIKILNSNFKNHEKLRIKLKNKVPKYGNDNDYADAIAQELMDIYCDEINKHSCYRTPGQFRPCLFTAGTHVFTGLLKAATPDGRKAGKPVSNSLSPSNNTERNGPTAVFNSVAKLCTEKMGSGMSLNMRLLSSLLRDEERRKKIIDLILGYFQLGGMHVQFNVLDHDTLKDAKLHPENYQDLVVRVSGYNAYFVNLDEGLQNDIMDRIEFESI
ncbi:MAG: hypothetical protein GF329_04925 [Candidatus Lokiarchaeota archaeon]|nr:hypothetical protein [Candidatus Lokiarchaeota archaeon]